MRKYVIYWTQTKSAAIVFDPPVKSEVYISSDLNNLYREIQENLYDGFVAEYNNKDCFK